MDYKKSAIVIPNFKVFTEMLKKGFRIHFDFADGKGRMFLEEETGNLIILFDLKNGGEHALMLNFKRNFSKLKGLYEDIFHGNLYYWNDDKITYFA